MQNIIDHAFENKQNLKVTDELRNAIAETLNKLSSGQLRIAEKKEGNWLVNQWVKKAILLSFAINDAKVIEGGQQFGGQTATWFDKVAPKFLGWTQEDYIQAGTRVIPGAYVRHSAYIGRGTVLMPCFVNVGAYVGDGTMIDTWSTVGSCAQIGKNCHISGGVGIGGVLEPLQANPVIIEDNCFIGARSEVAEGVIIEEGAVLSMGVYIGASTKIIDRETGQIFYGKVPAYSVVVPGTVPGKKLSNGEFAPSLYAAVIIKRVDEKTRAKTSINELLRQ